MPTYEFKCPGCETTIEKYFHLYSEHSIWCKECEIPMKKQFAATPAIFKGEGWGKSKSQ